MTLREIYETQGTQAAVDYLLEIRKQESKEPRLYLKNGYVNIPWIRTCGCSRIVLLGGRGTGKTYSVLKNLNETETNPYIFLRRTKTQIEMCCSSDGNPYKKLCMDTGIAIEPAVEKHYVNFYTVHYEDTDEIIKKVVYDKQISFATSLSTFYNLRGFDGSNFDTLFFDEIIREPLERRVQGEGKAYLNMIETIQRNREMEGRKPLLQILAGNTDSLDSEILQAIGAINPIERMKSARKEVYISRERNLAIFDLFDSPISKIKALTSLYTGTDNDDFKEMAISNDFNDLKTSRDIKSRPLIEYKPLFSINNKICVYEHKSNGEWYACRHISGNPQNYNLINREDLLKWKEKYYELYIYKVLRGSIIFDNYDTKVIFNNAAPF